MQPDNRDPPVMSNLKSARQAVDTVYEKTFDRGRLWIDRQRTTGRPLWWGHVRENGRRFGVCSYHRTKREALEWCLERLGVL